MTSRCAARIVAFAHRAHADDLVALPTPDRALTPQALAGEVGMGRDQPDQRTRDLPPEKTAADHAAELGDVVLPIRGHAQREAELVHQQGLGFRQDDHVGDVERDIEDRDDLRQPRAEGIGRVGRAGVRDQLAGGRLPQHGELPAEGQDFIGQGLEDGRRQLGLQRAPVGHARESGG